MEAKPYQLYGIQEVDRTLEEGEINRLVLSSPTGGGKTFMAGELVKRWLARNYKVALYTNRRLMVKQLSNDMEAAGIEHGIRAAKAHSNPDAGFQIISIQTEQQNARKAKQNSSEHILHGAKRVLVDECHLNTGPGMRAIMAKHIKEGAKIVGLSATPLDLEGVYQRIVQAGTNGELRDCQMLVPAIHFAPDEPDFKAFKRLKKKLANIEQDGWQPDPGQVVDLIMTPTIFGRVHHWFEKLNPEHDPTILFAPSVGGSLWFAQQFEAAGIKAAHVSANLIYVDGSRHQATKKLHEEIRRRSENGDLPIVCNRFVYREGVDMPWLKHGIFATLFGSLQTYLQAAGRLLRWHHSMKDVTFQDHGGNWWRWGSANVDRYWHIEDTGLGLQLRRCDQLRRKGPRDETEPFVCPECMQVLNCGRCTNCGWTPGLGWIKTRPVVSTDGTLRLMVGDIFRQRSIYKLKNGPEKWERIYWASAKNKVDRTFRMAAVLFAKDNHWQWPDPTWPLMPVRDDDWYMPISLVSFADLNPKLEKSNGEAQAPRGEARIEKEKFLFDGSYEGANAIEREALEADFSPWDDAPEPPEA